MDDLEAALRRMVIAPPLAPPVPVQEIARRAKWRRTRRIAVTTTILGLGGAVVTLVANGRSTNTQVRHPGLG